ncbi:MAG: amidase [Gammaproteobacteria bacterium]|nr:amidase [Gammaproteobacteria bacterium]
MSELIYRSASWIADAIRRRELGCREIAEACLRRIEQVNPSLNAVVQLVPERALAEADRLDAEVARGELRGPLHGVPMTIKDSLDTAGIVSTGGTLGRRDHVPQADAPVVARLRAAGAVLLGKSNTPELTLSAETSNEIYGRTSNPYDLARSPGGSSGGSAAIISAGGAALEIGSDTGGSIREPAHLCGIAGIKPTAGRTPRSGHIVPWGGGVLDGLTVLGPMARHVEDLALSLPLICGPDGEDPAMVAAPVPDPAALDPRGLRVAWYAANGVGPLAADIERVLDDTARTLAADGFSLTARVLPGMPRLADLTTRLREATNPGLIRRLLARYGTERPGPDLLPYLDGPRGSGETLIDPELLEQIDAARGHALAFFRKFDAVLCPPSHALAREHGSTREDAFSDWSYVLPLNLLGWPGAVVRAGTGRGDLPVGVQVVAPPWREDIALALAGAIEQRMGGFRPPPV